MNTENAKTVVLEASVNPHKLVATEVNVTHDDGTVMAMEIEGEGLVLHGEHGTLATESTNVLKYVQQEVNPVTQMMQKAFD